MVAVRRGRGTAGAGLQAVVGVGGSGKRPRGSRSPYLLPPFLSPAPESPLPRPSPAPSPPGSAPPVWLLTCRRPAAHPVTSRSGSGASSGSVPEERPAAGVWARQDEKGGFQAVSAQVVRWVRVPARGAGCYGRPGGLCWAGARRVAGAAAQPGFSGSRRPRATLTARAAP